MSQVAATSESVRPGAPVSVDSAPVRGAALNGAAAPETPAVAAAVHYQGDRWRLVVLTNRNGLSLTQAVSVDAEGQIAPLLEQYQVERLVRVAPSRETVARCAAVSVGSGAELGPALALMAEAQLPESIPGHRRGAGAIPEIDGGGAKTALLVGWKGEAPAALTEEGVEETWTTPAAALAVLRQGRGSSAVYADPEEGAVSMLVFGSKSIARVLIENATNPSAFARAVGTVVGETCSAAGVSAPVTQLGQSGVLLSIDAGVIPAVRSAVTGVPDQRSWFEQYGLALGAAMGALSKDSLVRGLTSMRASAPVKRESAAERAAGWLSNKKHAWGLAAAALAVLLLGPWVIASTRLAILESKAVGLGDRNRERTETMRRKAMYAQLDRSRWPMSKLLADVSAAIPMGVTTENIRLSSDQGGGLTITGSAETPELVNTMQANLNGTKLLNNVKVNRMEATGSSVEFDLTAEVGNPHMKAAGVEDFSTKTLAVRLYGEGALNTALPKNTGGRESAPVREPRASSRPSERTERAERPERSNGGGGGERSGDRNGERGGSRTSEAPTRPAVATPGEAPPPLTDAQIAKMDKAGAMKEWAARKTYPQKNPAVDATTKSRLEEEVRKLKEQMDKAGAAK